MNDVEDEFAQLYQGLIARVEPDPSRLRRGWAAVVSGIAGADPPAADPPLHFSEKYDRLGLKAEAPGLERQESGEET